MRHPAMTRETAPRPGAGEAPGRVSARGSAAREALDRPGQDAEVTDLIRHARSGVASEREEAWRALVDRYGRRVFALARSRVGSAELAEEIAQAVFAQLAMSLAAGDSRAERYEERGKFEAWLMRIAMNKVHDAGRATRRSRRAADGLRLVRTDSEIRGEDPEGAAEAFAGLRERDDSVATLRRAVARLGDRDREVIALRHHGEMGFKEIAEVLREPLGTVLARHHRALKKLRDLMESAETEDGAAAQSGRAVGRIQAGGANADGQEH